MLEWSILALRAVPAVTQIVVALPEGAAAPAGTIGVAGGVQRSHSVLNALRAGEGWKRLLKLPAEAAYFNSGVLLINLDGWRSRDLGREILDWIAANPDKITLADQDAINAVLWQAITPLPDCWNLQIGDTSVPLPA